MFYFECIFYVLAQNQPTDPPAETGEQMDMYYSYK